MAAAKFVLPVAAAVLAFALYAPALSYDTVIDDDQLLGTELSVRAIFLEPVQLQTPYYRPLTNASYAVLHAFDDGAPREAAAHFSNLIFYSAGVLLLFALCVRLLGAHRYAWPAAFVACLLFAVHPVHTESVAWIGARPDMIVGALIAATLLAYHGYRSTRSSWWLAAVWLLALATVMTKEVGWTIALLLPLYQWLFAPAPEPAPVAQRQPSRRRRSRAAARPSRDLPWLNDERARTALILASVAIIYIVLRVAAFDGLGGRGLSYDDLRPDRLLAAVGFYVDKAFVPRDFIAFYGEVPDDARYIVIGALALIAWCAALAITYVRDVRAVTFGLLWAAITLAPSLPVFVTNSSNAPIAERYLYLPTMGLALCVAWLAAAAIGRIVTLRDTIAPVARAAALAVPSIAVLALAGVWAYHTVDRLPAYEDLQSFWETTVRDNPTAGFPHAGLATVYEDAGRIDDAEAQYRLAVAGVITDEQRALAWSNLGALLSQTGDYAGAVEAHSAAVALRPRSAQLHYNFAVAHRRQATAADPPDPALLALALEEAQTAVDLDSDDPLRVAFLATVAFESGDFGLARETYRQVLRIEHTGRWADLARRELSRPELQ